MGNDENILVLPYGGDDDPNSGFSGSGMSSEERAREADRRGITSRRQRLALYHLGQASRHGLTYKEFGGIAELHHGQSSGALSNLHMGGIIARLKEERHGCGVYVLPQYVAGRDTVPYANTKTTQLLAQAAELLRTYPDCGHGPLPEDGCLGCEVKDWVRHYETRK